jgi:DNA polymerase III delta subunit
MPSATPSAIRKQIAQRKPDPVYLILGDDDAEMSRLAADMMGLVDDELRAFNAERLYAGDKGVTALAIVESARILPMMSDRRVVILLRAEKMLKPKRRGKAIEVEADSPDVDESSEPPTELDALDRYIREPVPQTTLVLVASDVDRTRKLYKTIQKHATIVDCWGLKGAKEARVDLREVARTAEQLVRKAVTDAGQQIDTGASRLIAERAGTDIARLRGDVERLLLFTAGKPRIAVDDARQIVSAETAQDDWAVTNAIQRRDAPEALRQIALALESGGVSYQILGQLAWWVREKMAMTDPRHVPAAIESLFRTDLELKNSGDARVLLERLVVELCRG